MRVRAIDELKDWSYGKGRNDYKRDLLATAQLVETNLKSFLGDCFFDLTKGIDWFNLNGNKDIEELKLRISTVILNTENVVRVNEVFVTLGVNRNFLIQYDVDTIYGNISDETEQEVV